MKRWNCIKQFNNFRGYGKAHEKFLTQLTNIPMKYKVDIHGGKCYSVLESIHLREPARKIRKLKRIYFINK